jgi:radical SAM superfamily enzyme with C-terminal helix-hairpin-helix motif
MKVTILDGYVDEPSRLGVPPYISPYPRYMAGAAIAAGHEPEYMTVDHWRMGTHPSGDLVMIISGPIVPGKYLRTMPMSRRELAAIVKSYDADAFVWHPSEPPGPTTAEGHHIWGCDPDAYLSDLLTGGTPRKRRRTPEEWAEWAILGAGTVRQHQDFPQPLIAELDLSYGCPHYITGGCSFCIEPLYGEPSSRRPADVMDEARAILKAGCTNLRLGGCSCIFSYWAIGTGETDRPKPNVKALHDLFDGLFRLPGIRVLHTDNADPGVMAAHPEETARVLEMIVSACTSGNVLSLGLESADPAVAEANNLNSTPADAMAAIRMINAAGAERGPTGLPMLLPGLNILCGLDGESPATFDANMRFLSSVLDSGLSLRRINIRQVAPTRRDFTTAVKKKEFVRFKEQVRNVIDAPMLARIAPAGSVLVGVFTEVKIGKVMFGRQIGTYPILVGMPQDLEPGKFLDVKVASHGSRSLTALEHPLDINSCQLSALEAIPGIGRKRAIRVFRARPIKNRQALLEALDEPKLAETIMDFAGIIH